MSAASYRTSIHKCILKCIDREMIYPSKKTNRKIIKMIMWHNTGNKALRFSSCLFKSSSCSPFSPSFISYTCSFLLFLYVLRGLCLKFFDAVHEKTFSLKYILTVFYMYVLRIYYITNVQKTKTWKRIRKSAEKFVLNICNYKKK